MNEQILITKWYIGSKWFSEKININRLFLCSKNRQTQTNQEKANTKPFTVRTGEVEYPL